MNENELFKPRLGDVIDFALSSADGKAFDFVVLPSGSLGDSCYIEDRKYENGVVALPAKAGQNGVLKLKGDGEEEEKKFPFFTQTKEYDQSSYAAAGYGVSFRVLHHPGSGCDVFGNGFAINLKIESGIKRYFGYITNLFDGYGFIEKEAESNVWFHFRLVG